MKPLEDCFILCRVGEYRRFGTLAVAKGMNFPKLSCKETIAGLGLASLLCPRLVETVRATKEQAEN